MDNKKIAKDFFLQGFNCSQSVFATFSDKYGLPKEIALKIGCGFGGGMRNAEICGAVSGAVMVISLRYGHFCGNDTDSKTLCYQKTKEFTETFKSRNNSIICRDLLNCDIFEEGVMELALEKNLFKTTCLDMISNAVEILEELGY